MPSTLLIRGGLIATLGDDNRILNDHALLIEDGLIKKIAPVGDFTGNYDKTLDAQGKLVLPGFINAHMHFYSTLVRGLGKAAPSKDFNEVLENLWWRLDKKLTLDDCYVSAVVPLIDAVRKGTTTLIDHHASPYAARGSLGAIAEAVQKVGVRASLCYEVSDRDGDKVAQEGIDENIAFAKHAAADTSGKLGALFGLHAAFTIGDATLEKAVTAASELDVGFHVHVAEAASDEQHSLEKHGMRVVERLHKHGVLGAKSIAAHCVHVDDNETALLAETNTAVAHNPQSNLNNGVGIADIVALSERGVLVGLGTDAMTVNMLEEMRVALWAQHLRGDPSVGFMEATGALLKSNAKIANRTFAPKVGVLADGFAGDVVLLDYQPPTPFDGSTFLGHMAFGVPHAPVDTTVVGGDVLMENKELKLAIDEAEVAAHARELASKLWDRF